MDILDLGRRGYQETLELQKELLEKRIQDLIPDTLILVEHQPVYTAGRALHNTPYASHVQVPDLGTVPVVAAERGGKMTYHGPGQIVGYPIFALTRHDIRQYLRDMERILVASLNVLSLDAKPCPQTLLLEPGQLETGVWVGDFKLGSIGIAVKHWVSYHGFSLNVCPDLRYFDAIEPCGFQGQVISSVQKEKNYTDAQAHTVFESLKKDVASRFTELSAFYMSLGNKNLSAVSSSPS